jgi:hypothetical protein
MKPLNPKAVVVHTADHAATSWAVRLPSDCRFGDIFTPHTWVDIEILMRSRGGRCPRRDDLIRCIGAGFDIVAKVDAVSDGYRLTLYGGRPPSLTAQVVSDLAAIPAEAEDLTELARSLRQRWQAMGVTTADLGAAKRLYSKERHPDVGVHAGNLAVANALIDKVAAHLKGSEPSGQELQS